MFVDFLYIFSMTMPPSSRPRVVFFRGRRKGFDFDNEWMFFNDVVH